MDEETKQKIYDSFQQGAPIEVLARHYKVEVSEVMEAIGQPEMNHITFVGDQVDPSELMPGTPTVQFYQDRVNYTKN